MVALKEIISDGKNVTGSSSLNPFDVVFWVHDVTPNTAVLSSSLVRVIKWYGMYDP